MNQTSAFIKIVVGLLTLVAAMTLNGIWLDYVAPLASDNPSRSTGLILTIILFAPIVIFQLLGAYTLGSFVLNKLEELKNRFKYGR